MSSTVEVRLARELYADGHSSGELARRLRRDAITHVRHGAYASEPAADPRQAHLRLIDATMPRLRRPAVVSHTSAAVLHGLPVWPDELHRVHLTRSQPSGGRIGTNLHLHTEELEPEDTTELSGVTVTSLGRTTADVARSTRPERAVAVADAALRLGLPREELTTRAEPDGCRHGMGQLRRVARFADARSESVGESVSRLVLSQLGLPAPIPQFEILDPVTGAVLARADFGWPEQRTLGEFDGRVKYGSVLDPSRTAEDVLFAEKLREDLLRDLGWEVVRWIWPELRQPAAIRNRLERAFLRGVRRAS